MATQYIVSEAVQTDDGPAYLDIGLAEANGPQEAIRQVAKLRVVDRLRRGLDVAESPVYQAVPLRNVTRMKGDVDPNPQITFREVEVTVGGPAERARAAEHAAPDPVGAV